ncbi:hypothetical protein F2Q69_00040011 [Brassica cretica]|uniref:Uncharacterized protein n=1 Tax=Brassica cretica TaxID=69181 RepID=A0A8S9N872_BRACR|nr:hypothetical protein F2Q69_00040011 [Brassica cretica]
MEMTIEASTTRVDANKPPSSGTVVDVESDEKQVTTPDPRWPYINRWSSNPLHEASAPAALKLVPPHSPTGPMVETESGTSLTDNGENESPLDDLKRAAPLGDSDVVIRSATEPEVNPKPYSTSQGAKQNTCALKIPYLTNQAGLSHETNFNGLYTQERVQPI